MRCMRHACALEPVQRALLERGCTCSFPTVPLDVPVACLSIISAVHCACSLPSRSLFLQDAWEARLASIAAAWRRRRAGAAGGKVAGGTDGSSTAGTHSSGQEEATSVNGDGGHQPPTSVQLAVSSAAGSGPLPGPSPRRRTGVAFPTSP